MLHFGTIDIRIEIFLLVLSLLAIAGQFFLCQRTKKTILRALPIVLGLVATAVFLLLSLLLKGWDGIGCLFLAIICALFTFSLLVGYFVWRLSHKKKKK